MNRLCGSHVRLCREALVILNGWYKAKAKYVTVVSAKDLRTVLWSERTFELLLIVRAVSVADFVTVKELELVKGLISGQRLSDKKCLQTLCRKGMLVEKNDAYTFSSPVMARSVLKKIVGEPPKRAESEPKSLEELIIFILSSLDYAHLKTLLGKPKTTRLFFGRIWQMEFYKTAIQCTPQ